MTIFLLRLKFRADFCDFLHEDLFFLENTFALCPLFLALASSIFVLGFERVCPWKVGPCPWSRIFLCSGPWTQALCPRLHLCVPSNKNPQNSKLITTSTPSTSNLQSTVTPHQTPTFNHPPTSRKTSRYRPIFQHLHRCIHPILPPLPFL